MSNWSKFKDFFSFLATVQGDLANITSPPFFLAQQSIVEVSTCWTERPSLFVAPALEDDPQKRALLVLKWIICSFRTQFYVGADINVGIKKPINAFLGELFLAKWNDDIHITETVTEQVSHHPPISACYMWNDEHKIRGEGYSRVEMTFNGNINIKQTGHAVLHIDKYDERHLIPFPNPKVKGFLSGHLYPEIGGNCHLISSSGFVSQISFSGRGVFSGTKNSFEATMWRRDDEKKAPIHVIRGQWSGRFTIYEGDGCTEIETWDPERNPRAPAQVADVANQDPWESRNAWQKVLSALKEGDMNATVTEKSKLEEAQRAMRKTDKAVWEPLFFSTKDKHPLFDELASAVGWNLQAEKTKGVWYFDHQKAAKAKKPFHAPLTPFG